MQDNLRLNLLGAIQRFHSQPSLETEQRLRSLRLQYAAGLISGDPQVAVELLASGLDDPGSELQRSPLRFLPMLAEEQQLVHMLGPVFAEGLRSPTQITAWYVARLFTPAHEIGFQPPIASVAFWLHKPFLEYLLETPFLFQRPGDGAKYLAYLRGVLQTIASTLTRDEYRIEYLQYALAGINTIACTFTADNVRDVMSLRGDLIDMYLRRLGAEVDWTFPESGPRARTRVGFLVKECDDRNENHITLAHVKHLDRARFETFLYACRTKPIPFTREMSSHFDHFRPMTALALTDCVKLIRQDDLDVILSANSGFAGISHDVLLYSHRLARQQLATTAIWPTTTGLRSVDAMISSAATEPPDAQDHYREQLLLAGDDFICFDKPAPVETPTTSLPPLVRAIPAHVPLLVSGAAHGKIGPEVLECWMRILRAVPDSCLILYPFGPNWLTRSTCEAYVFRRRLADACMAAGIRQDRVWAGPCLPHSDINALLRRADVYLDSFPYSGTTSLLDALFQHCPSVALAGGSQRAMQGSYMLRSVGLASLAADSVEDYCAKAVQLASTASLRAHYSRVLTDRMPSAPCLNVSAYGERFAGVVERASQQLEECLT